MELGGAYTGPTQDRILRQAADMGVETYLTNEVENTIWHEHVNIQDLLIKEYLSSHTISNILCLSTY